MTTSSDLLLALSRRLRANWPALLLPLLALEFLPLRWASMVRPGSSPPTGNVQLSWQLLIVAVAVTVFLPRVAALIVPYAMFCYGCAGFFVLHSVLIASWGATFYGVLEAWPGRATMLFVLPQALAFIVASLWLLTVTGAPGGTAVRTAVRQFRGAGGQPPIVPPLLLLPVLGLWEEALSGTLWFSWGGAGGLQFLALVLLGLAIAMMAWRRDFASLAAVLGLMFFGVYIVYAALKWGEPSPGMFSAFYGPVLLDNQAGRGFTVLEGIALIGAGVALIPRLLTTLGADTDLARQAQALTQRVSRLTQTRSDATETAVAELRRIERDLHDGAQARLVAVGMSLRAAERLMAQNPDAALALVAEARETSSRALTDLRDLVRGIYPPVLADRGLGDAVRALALDAPLDVAVAVQLPGEPPMPVAAAVYFAIAEALTNTARHAEAGTARIEIGYATGMLRATVTDDGHGGADPSRGTGLTGVERRLATFDGILAVSSPPGGPTIIAIEVPCALLSGKTCSCCGTA